MHQPEMDRTSLLTFVQFNNRANQRLFDQVARLHEEALNLDILLRLVNHGTMHRTAPTFPPARAIPPAKRTIWILQSNAHNNGIRAPFRMVSLCMIPIFPSRREGADGADSASVNGEAVRSLQKRAVGWSRNRPCSPAPAQPSNAPRWRQTGMTRGLTARRRQRRSMGEEWAWD